MRCGLYAIRNLITGKFYVGSSVRLGRRLSDHKGMLRRGTHDNIHLQRAFTKDGEGAFTFCVLAILESAERLVIEQRMLDRVVGTPNCYNIAPSVVCGTLGRKMPPMSEERREKLRQFMLGRPVTAESRAKISAKNRGKPNYWKGKQRSPETREKMAAWQRGRILSEAHKEKVRQANIGKKQSTETKAKRNATLRGRSRPPYSAEWRKNMSEAARRRHARKGVSHL